MKVYKDVANAHERASDASSSSSERVNLTRAVKTFFRDIGVPRVVKGIKISVDNITFTICTNKHVCIARGVHIWCRNIMYFSGRNWSYRKLMKQ